MLTLAKIQGSKRYTPPDFFRPYHFLTLALVLKAGKYSGLDLPEKFENYAIRMGLFEAAGLPLPKSVRKLDASGRFHPITVLTDWLVLADTAANLSAICTHKAVSEKTVESLIISIVELLENCLSHAKTNRRDFHGLVAAQAWFNGNLAQIAIADVGVGIRARLMDNPNLHHLLLTQNACEVATRYGITADEKGHSGYGLTLAKGFARMAEASGAIWDGTLVIFEWDTSRPLDTQSVYQRWPLPQGFDDDDFV
jgi:hypothetical protein